jgi:hypothetical protein
LLAPIIVTKLTFSRPSCSIFCARTKLIPRLTWDEENLAAAETERGTLMKIDEPKTPFVRYQPELENEDGGASPFHQLKRFGPHIDFIPLCQMYLPSNWTTRPQHRRLAPPSVRGQPKTH